MLFRFRIQAVIVAVIVSCGFLQKATADEAPSESPKKPSVDGEAQSEAKPPIADKPDSESEKPKSESGKPVGEKKPSKKPSKKAESRKPSGSKTRAGESEDKRQSGEQEFRISSLGDARHPMVRFLKEFDRNKDGKLNQEEQSAAKEAYMKNVENVQRVRAEYMRRLEQMLRQRQGGAGMDQRRRGFESARPDRRPDNRKPGGGDRK
ncbi:MAG: hypothetical protein O3A00_05590 [Planctomycetota bacterium]|nr:hypothetical protein [Planctomycetota bacterium]